MVMSVPRIRRYEFRYRRSKSDSEPGWYSGTLSGFSLDAERMFV